MTVEKRTDAVDHMVRAAFKGRALMAGTEGMQAAGEKYLPRFKAEDPQDYDARLKSSWLYNAYEKTIEDMTGRVFAKPVEVADAPSKIIEWAEDIDMQGQDLSVFAKEVFQDGFASGVSYIMADAPKREGETTQAEASAKGLRPYLVHLKVEDVLGWKTALFGNVMALSQFRIMEAIQSDDPEDEFAQVSIEQVRVLDRDDTGVSVRLYRENKEGQWYIHDEYPTDAKEITVIPYYAFRSGFFTGNPVLNDLADANIAHWRKQSDYDHISHVANVPLLHISGRRAEDGPLVVSAAMATTSENVDAKMEWVEHKGQAIGALERGLDRIESQMETLGLQLLVEGSQTATGAVLDDTKETAGLGMMADALKDALEQSLLWMADYGGLGDASITVEVNKEFGTAPLTAQEVTAMQKDVAMGYLSLEEYYEERKRRGVLRPDLDTEADIDKVEAQGPDLGGDDGGQ